MAVARAKKFRAFVLASLACAALSANARSRADADAAGPSSNAEAARRARVVVTVGDRKVTVGELEDRLASIPPSQLATLGGTSRDELVKAYVDQVLVRDLLLAAGAEQRGLDKKLPTSYQLTRARSTATLRALRRELPSAAAIPEADVRRYYDENRSRFDSPERVDVWRILVKTRAEADEVLAAAKREPTTAKFNDLAREHSIDKATNLRGGNLGFLAPDGTSNEAGLKVDPALVKAAAGVKDGELVPELVAEGPNWAVVWRRGTVQANKRTLEESEAQIRATLFRERTEAAQKALVDRLRKEHLGEVHEDLLGQIELRPFDAGISLPRPPPSAR